MKYFTMRELTYSATAHRANISNVPGQIERNNLEELVAKILDPLREAWGKPIHVNSGYRNIPTNRLVGGVAGSMHLRGWAADITTGNEVDNRRLYQLVQDLKLPFFELIGQKYGFRWLHISYNPNRKQRRPE